MQFYRAMQAGPDGFPLVGRSARALGLRVPEDIDPTPDGVVHSGKGGMSVNPHTMWNVPNHRRPRGLGRGSTGPLYDRIYSVDGKRISIGDLIARLDPLAPNRHALVEPAHPMALAQYEDAIARTRPDWRQEWP